MDKKDIVIAQIEKLERCYLSGKSISDFEREEGVYIGFYYDFLRKRINKYVSDGIITDDLRNAYKVLYDNCKYGQAAKTPQKHVVVECDDSLGEEDDTSKNKIEETEGFQIIRSTTDTYEFNGVILGRIQEYIVTYKIDKQWYEATLSREDMELIYRLYSAEGENQSQKVLCRHFDSIIDRRQMKKLLFTMGITKACAPFPRHVFEENSITEILDKTNTIKENSFFRKLDAERIGYLEKRNFELSSQIQNLKKKHELIANFDASNIQSYNPKSVAKSDNCLFLYISDCHVGAHVDNRSIYNNPYDKQEFFNRLDSIVDLVAELKNSYTFDKIVVCNLGDSLDGYDAKTTRGGHIMPQNMDNKEQFETFTKGMIRFFDSLHSLNASNRIDYICVGESNHGGDYEWAANVALEAYLSARYPLMHIQIFKKYIGVCNYGKHTLVLSHGKDNKDMFKNMPLTLNDKTERYLLEYIDSLQDVRDNIHIIKGDLHQSATNYSRKFRYRNVGSLFGSSKWIHHNFGDTKACLDYDIIDTNSNLVLSGRKELN